MRPRPEAAQTADAQLAESAMKDRHQDDDELSEPAGDRMKKARKEDQLSSSAQSQGPPNSGSAEAKQPTQEQEDPSRASSAEAWSGWKKGTWKESSSGWASKTWKDDKSKGYKR